MNLILILQAVFMIKINCMREELKSRLNPAAIQSSTFIVPLLFKNITAKVYRTVDIPVTCITDRRSAGCVVGQDAENGVRA